MFFLLGLDVQKSEVMFLWWLLMMPQHPFTGGPTCLFVVVVYFSFFLFVHKAACTHRLLGSSWFEEIRSERHDFFCSWVVFVPFSSTRISHFSFPLSWTIFLNLTHSNQSDNWKTVASMTVICFRLHLFCVAFLVLSVTVLKSWLARFFRYREKCCNYWYFPFYFRPISTDNVGRQMLEKMGWSEGEGLGREGAGRREPVSIELSDEYPWIKFASINWVLLGLVFRSLSTSA